IIAERTDVDTIRYCDGAPDRRSANGTAEASANTYNVLDVTLRAATGAVVPPDARSFLTTSACGVCGKTSLDQVRTKSRFDIAATELQVAAQVLADMPDTLREHQRVFDATGGLHAAALFTADGELVVLREDVGRHNAVDKVVGWALDNSRIPAAELVLIVSGRASFELVQKSVMAGIPMLGAVSAPSSLAVDLAEESGTTLIGFLRGDSMNVYTNAHRLR
ncbi:formate dehydrogenase accessory sulfurtransferase FdhD, partial [Aldersonia kunmingensis]|uniref:formate dehydrogenase accessory sulfurtransferase FdhD n=1 Tax=Aldersonia kunmingensis TaxID=408066 RepID=UPI000A6DC0DD